VEFHPGIRTISFIMYWGRNQSLAYLLLKSHTEQHRAQQVMHARKSAAFAVRGHAVNEAWGRGAVTFRLRRMVHGLIATLKLGDWQHHYRDSGCRKLVVCFSMSALGNFRSLISTRAGKGVVSNILRSHCSGRVAGKCVD